MSGISSSSNVDAFMFFLRKSIILLPLRKPESLKKEKSTNFLTSNNDFVDSFLFVVCRNNNRKEHRRVPGVLTAMRSSSQVLCPIFFPQPYRSPTLLQIGGSSQGLSERRTWIYASAFTLTACLRDILETQRQSNPIKVIGTNCVA